jgi:RNA polymerase sigma-70 factor (ECF subfamily)
LDNKQKLEKLERILNKLPPKQKQVFIMRNFDELSYEEISQITGKSVGGLKATYFHAIKKITEWMNNEIE